MIHIIWSGKGFLVAVFVFGSSLVANLATNCITGSGAYWDAHKWPFAISLFVASAACSFVGQWLQKRGKRVLIDTKTGEEVVLGKSHTLFFIPMIWWGPILAVCGFIAVGVDFMRS
jgi:hypothetical protein